MNNLKIDTKILQFQEVKTMKEIWKKIPDFPTNYEISNFGNVRREGFDGEYTELHQTIVNGIAKISCEGKQFPVHRLVALTFVPNPNNYTVVHHIDGNKRNNHSDNLDWISAASIEQNKYIISLSKDKIIECIETGEIYGSLISAAFFTGIPREAIQNALKTGDVCFGKHFKYAMDRENLSGLQYISINDMIKLSNTNDNITKIRKSFQNNS